MNRPCCALLLLWAIGCATPAGAQDPSGDAMEPWPELVSLRDASGQAYVEQRERFLTGARGGIAGAVAPAAAVDVERLAAFARHPDPLLAKQAQILLGWQAHRALYTEILAEVEAIDFEFVRQTMGGIARVWRDLADRAAADWKRDVLPLCWEVALKRQGDWPTWKVIGFLRMLGAVPDVSSRPVAAWLAEHGVEDLRVDARELLARLPAEEDAAQPGR